MPSPLHSGHAPCGELNENNRGSSSGIETLQSLHARFSLKSVSLNSFGFSGKVNEASSTSEKVTRPSARRSDSSTITAMRWRIFLRSSSSFSCFALTTPLSITTEMACLLFLRRLSSSSRLYIWPSMRTRRYPFC